MSEQSEKNIRQALYVAVANKLQGELSELEECQEMGRSFMKFEMNKYFTFKVQCIEDLRKET